MALNELKNGTSQYNFFEGMMCEGGCIGGPCNLTHSVRNKMCVDKFSSAGETDIKTAQSRIKRK
jgi:iron only hydrogenase large subunit-like protein